MLYQKILFIVLSQSCFNFTLLQGAAAAAATSVSRQVTVRQALDALYGRFVGNSARVDLVVNHILDYCQPRVIRFEVKPGTLAITTDNNPTQEYAIKIEPGALFDPPSYCWSDGRFLLTVSWIRMIHQHAYRETLLIAVDQDENVTSWHDPNPSILFLPNILNLFRSNNITGYAHDDKNAAIACALLQEFKRRIASSAATSSSSSSARSLPESSVSASPTPTFIQKMCCCSCWW